MALDLLGDPFANTAEIDITDTDIRGAAPSMPDTKVQDLLKAQRNQRFDKQEGINERYLLNKEYMSVASFISAELGPFVLDNFENAQPIVEAAALRLLNEGDDTGSFRGENASGGSQYDLMGISTSTFGQSPSDRPYTTGGTGSQDVFSGYTLDENNQSVIVLGYYQTTNPRVVEHAQLDVDDGESRQPFEIYSHMGLGTLQAVDLPSVEYLDEGDEVDLSINATQDADTDFYPYGVDINTASNLLSL